MDNQNLPEIWQVDVSGEIYETNFEDLADWIAEGSLTRQDRVRRGNLRWLEAGKIPLLYDFFNAKERGIAPPIAAISDEADAENFPEIETANVAAPMMSENHSAKSINASFAPKNQTILYYQNDVVESFGFADFAKALIYPFKFKASLIFGAIFFTIFWLGQSVWIFGGLMIVSAVFCSMLANTLTFGILANTVENFSQGKITSDFMPRFDDFSAWEDVIHPFLLSIGVYAVSFGLLIALLVGATWNAVDSLKEIDRGKDKIVSAVLPVPPNDMNLAKQSTQVSQLIEQLKKQNKFKDGNMPDENAIIQPQTNSSNEESAIFENLQNQLKQAQTEPPETTTTDNLSELPGNVMRLSLAFSIPIFLAFLWGVFYFPAACAVAAYTRSFTATLNPVIGFDTIKRLGFDYAKILGVLLILGSFAVFINSVLGTVFAPLDLPMFGNLPVKALDGILYFYFFIVFAVVLGFVIYNNSRSLNLYRG